LPKISDKDRASMIWIRADANSEIGMGHLMRCLSVAAALQTLGKEVCFILADDTPKKILEERGVPCVILQTDYRKMERELDIFVPLLQKHSPELLLVDSYYMTEAYFRVLSEWVKVAYIDDMIMFPYPVHTLINYNVYGDVSLYEESRPYVNKMLMGLDYVPLRQEFQNVSYEINPKVKNVLITTGGSDKYNLAGKILQRVLEEERIRALHYHVVSGAFNQNLPMLEALAEEYENVHIHKKVSRMSDLIKQCDVAISAAGSTLYELCAVGVPIICFSFAENQERMVESFVNKGIVSYGGHYLEQKEKLLDEMAETLQHLQTDFELRSRLSKQERKLVDGKGAIRIAECLCRN